MCVCVCVDLFASHAWGTTLSCMVQTIKWLCWGAGVGVTAAIVPVTVLGLASNGADLVVAIFVTSPDLNNWYEHDVFPCRTFSLAVVSLAVTVAVIKQGTIQHIKFA